MTKKIYIHELECYKQATEEKRRKLRISEEKYFDLEGLPSGQIREILETFVWERGKALAPSSLASELLYYNNIRNFLIEKNIKELHYDKQEKLLRLLRGWMMEHGYALTSRKYKPEYDVVVNETSGIEKHMKKLLRFIKPEDNRDEQEKDVWELNKFEFEIRDNPIINTKTINFTNIRQEDMRTEMKRAIYLQLKYMSLTYILAEISAMNRFSEYLARKHPEILSLQDLERKQIEEYLIYLQTEDKRRKDYRSELYSLKNVISEVGKIYEQKHIGTLFVNTDFPSSPRYVFKYRTDAEIKRLNSYIFKMDEQISRCLIIHQMLGARISETLTLKVDCLTFRNEHYFVRIDTIKSTTYEKPVSEELAELIRAAISYTQEHYGETTYIFVNADDPTRPYQYAMIQKRIMVMIRQNDIRDDHGELMQFGTHIYRHSYGKKLTEMHVEDWVIARLFGHKTLRTVHHYRQIGNKMMADETRKTREKMDSILLQIIEGWEGYEIR